MFKTVKPSFQMIQGVGTRARILKMFGDIDFFRGISCSSIWHISSASPRLDTLELFKIFKCPQSQCRSVRWPDELDMLDSGTVFSITIY